MDEKINGLADFKASADFARTLNATLQEKMMEANEERAQALFTKGMYMIPSTNYYKASCLKIHPNEFILYLR